MTLPYDYARCEGRMATSSHAFGSIAVGQA